VEGHRPFINRAGFRRKEGSAWDYLILPEIWRKEICKGFDPAMIAKAMIDKGWIEPGDGSNRARKESLPGIGQKRVYVIKSVF
jgi:putative DNA primase/helicase